MRSFLFLISGLIFLMLFTHCEDNVTPDPDDQDSIVPLQITRFYFPELNPAVEANIDQEKLTITAAIPRSGNIRQLAYAAEIPEGATISPPSGFAYDFQDPLQFTLRKGVETRRYTATITYAASAENKLISVRFPDLFREGVINGQNISITVPFGTNLTEVLIQMDISPFATVQPASGSKVNLSNPLQIKVIAEDGTENIFTLTATVQPQETGVRAFWIPDPGHSPFLTSRAEIEKWVALAKELNFNTLFVGAWARTRILYPSQVLADNSTYSTARDGMFTPNYGGGTGDPLKDLVEVAHLAGLKVILWYEYGFMARWGSAPTPQNDPILAVRPHWNGWGINNFGNDTIPSNYNGTDYYYNAYHPEVQKFLLDLVMEAVNNYNIDGVQGDDRMPAMPRNSGYDYHTVARYKAEHGGQAPPTSPSNSAWVRWRLDILNQFGRDLYNVVKAAKPQVLVTNSPNPYPWAMNNLMQEWPKWLDDGIVEILSVQAYRYNISAYRATINEILYYFNAHGDKNLQRLAPGIILYGSAGLTDPNLVYEKMMYNRSVGITGESFFYDVPLHDERIKRVIRAMYPGPAKFPQF
jgi:uncharacterized lipoprotein YddW (UPF0748 family)